MEQQSTWERLAPLTGVIFVAIVVAVFAIGGSTPGDHETAQEVQAFYGQHHDKHMALAFILALSIPFLTVLHQHPAIRAAACWRHGSDRQCRICRRCAGGGGLWDSRLRALCAGRCGGQRRDDRHGPNAQRARQHRLHSGRGRRWGAGAWGRAIDSASWRLAEVAGLGRRRDRRGGVHACRVFRVSGRRDLGRDRQHLADPAGAIRPLRPQPPSKSSAAPHPYVPSPNGFVMLAAPAARPRGGRPSKSSLVRSRE